MFVAEHVHVRTRAELVLDREKPQPAPVVVQTAGRCRLLSGADCWAVQTARQGFLSRQLWLRPMDFLARTQVRDSASSRISVLLEAGHMCTCRTPSSQTACAAARAAAGSPVPVAPAAARPSRRRLPARMRPWPLPQSASPAARCGSGSGTPPAQPQSTDSTTSLLLWPSRRLASLLSRMHGTCAVAIPGATLEAPLCSRKNSLLLRAFDA